MILVFFISLIISLAINKVVLIKKKIIINLFKYFLLKKTSYFFKLFYC